MQKFPSRFLLFVVAKKILEIGDCTGSQELANRDRDYVPLKTLLMAESTEITDTITKENSV